MLRKEFLFLMTAAIFLAGCEKKLTYSYLMLHPFVLQEQIDECQSLNERSVDKIAYCETVIKAANDLNVIINEQRLDPAKFGMQIMQAEIAYVKAKQEVKAAKQQLQALSNNKGQEADLEKARAKLQQATVNCDEQREKMKILLGVVGMNSPE